MNDVLFAFMISLIAGLSTGIGGLVVLLTKTTNKSFLSSCLSFSAGVMLYISFAELFIEAQESLKNVFAGGVAYLILTVSFFCGIAIMALIDKLIPDDGELDDILDPIPQQENIDKQEIKDLKRTGISTTIAVTIHNFPEGLITFIAALYNPALGVAVALAIIIHNIPEGIATATPIYYATGNKLNAFFVAIGSGLTEPLGALIAWLFLRNIISENDALFGIIFAAIAGIMVFVAMHQLLPTAQRYGKHHLVMKWLFAGMAVMAISLVLLEFYS